MKSKILAWSQIPLLILTVLFFNTSVFAAENDKEAIENADKYFYTALNQMFTGDLDQMKVIWSHANDVTYMGPGGEFNIGWEKVLKTWKKQAAMKLGGKVEPADTQITMGRDMAVVNCYEKGENSDTNGNVQKVSIRATNVFRKEGGKWKMIGHHTDLLSYLAKS